MESACVSLLTVSRDPQFEECCVLITKRAPVYRGDSNMAWFSGEEDLKSLSAAQRIGLQVLLVLLFLYFSFSGASELGLVSAISPKFAGYLWLGRIVGVIEMIGALALLRPEGLFGGAIFLSVAMASAVILTLIRQQPGAAAESLLMFNVSAAIAYWRRPR